MNINAWWLLLIIPVSLAVGCGLALWYITTKIKKMMGIKSWKEFGQQIKKAQELQKKMEKGDMNSMMAEINKDPKLRKQLEEFKKKFGGI